MGKSSLYKKNEIFEYENDLRISNFVLCPQGNGIDTHRIWESLYCGSIPIVEDHIGFDQFKNLPIMFVDDFYKISEKSLENFYYIELILNIYPNAKFINPYRNLIDNIFAIYKQFLSNVSWSHSLEDILLYIDNYLSTISYFKQKYPNNIFSISLENFTNNPKKLSMEMYEFCKLAWDEKCLEFHKRKDLFINTASNNQIRNSVQKYDGSKYQYYKQMLEPYLKKYDWINLGLKN